MERDPVWHHRRRHRCTVGDLCAGAGPTLDRGRRRTRAQLQTGVFTALQRARRGRDARPHARNSRDPRLGNPRSRELSQHQNWQIQIGRIATPRDHTRPAVCPRRSSWKGVLPGKRQRADFRTSGPSDSPVPAPRRSSNPLSQPPGLFDLLALQRLRSCFQMCFLRHRLDISPR